MTDNKRQHECPPVTENPADQPRPPGDEKTCTDPQPPTCPPYDGPTPCPPTTCHCPAGPTSTPDCLEKLIEQQASMVAAADKAGKFRDELVKLYDSAKKGSQDYNKDKYDALVKLWDEQDLAIASLIQLVVCHVPCWRCVIECHVCQAIDRIKNAEQWLYADGSLPTSISNLYDKLHWHTRNREARQRDFDRVDAVMKAWATPGKTIEQALAANLAAINKIKGALSAEPGKAVYDLFVTVISLHLAIAPPKGSVWKTRIDKKYTEFCPCDEPPPADDCCGPDVGPSSIRKRIVGPRPYLINPNDYFTLICCLVEHRYGKARQALTDADAALTAVQNEIARYKALVEGIRDFEKNVRPTVPSAINCCDYECPDDEDKPKPRQGY